MGSWYIHEADAFQFLQEFEPESVDCIITDIPYESLEKHRKVGTTTRLTNEWFGTIPNSRLPILLQRMYRVMARNSHLYFFCDAETMFAAKPAGEAAGFKFWKPLIWDKRTIGMGYHYRSRCERILFFEKGQRKLNDLGVADILPVKRINNGYPTEKPVNLLRTLVRQSTVEGESVLDPFCGSGSTVAAAYGLGRIGIGADISEKAVAWSRDRLGSLEAAMKKEKESC